MGSRLRRISFVSGTYITPITWMRIAQHVVEMKIPSNSVGAWAFDCRSYTFFTPAGPLRLTKVTLSGSL